MWFDDEIISGKKLGAVKRRRGHATTLNVRQRKSKRGESRHGKQIAVLILVPLIVVAAVVGIWFGFKGIGYLLFSGNDRFTITRLQIRDEGTAAHDFIRGEQGIKEGSNLFSFDPSELQRKFLARAHAYREIKITRSLPDVLIVETVPRVPIARIVVGWRQSLVTDKDGAVFSSARTVRHLPALVGYKGEALQPGARISGMSVAAVQLVDVCRNPQLSLEVKEVDIGNREYLVLRADYEGVMRQIRLTWSGMGARTPESRMELLRKLGRWVQVMQAPAGANETRFDGTYHDRIYAL